MPEIFTDHLETPIGRLEIRAGDSGILSVDFIDRAAGDRRRKSQAQGRPAVLEACLSQLGEYFRGERTSFDLPIWLEGTDFQMRVWSALVRIPYGRTTTWIVVAAQALLSRHGLPG
jgi:methylated-DNA-[protein]-cysteine S-methyltransferase